VAYKGTLKKLVKTALILLLAGIQAMIWPAVTQAQGIHNIDVASSAHSALLIHHNLDIAVQNPWRNQNNNSQTGAGTTGVSHHWQDNSISTSGMKQSGNLHHVLHSLYTHQTGNTANTSTNQTNSTNGQNLIGGYHAGYVWHHGGSDNSFSQFANQQSLTAQSATSSGITGHLNHDGSTVVTLQHHFNHSGLNSLANQSGNNPSGQSSFHQGYFNTQTAVSLAGSKSDNGSLLGSANLPSFFNLDLSSSQAIIRANNSLPVTITVGGYFGANGNIVGGVHQIVNPGQMLTAAQYVAMEQVVTSGQQTLVLTDHGTAISGLITLVAGQVGPLSSVEVPTHVLLDTVGFTSSNPLSVTGATQVFGTVYNLEQTANVTAALNSGSLFVGGRGTISDSLSNQSLFNTIFGANGLNLGVVGNLTNQGTISSVGTLTINAGQISNVSTSGHQAMMTGQNVNLFSSSGSVRNSGQIIASTGNVQFNSVAALNININNTNGLVQALQGSINVRDDAYAGSANLNLTGGDWLSKDVNLNSGSGIAAANIGKVTGAINTNAAEAHVSAATQNLIIGNTNLSGDPSFFNTAGDVTIGGNLNFSGQDLAIVAQNNIVTAVGAGSIRTSSPTSNGGNITMIAGADFTSSGAASGSNNKAATLTVSGGTTAGGYIDLNGNISGSNAAISSFNSASNAANGNGGNVTLVAYGGSASSAGVVNLPSSVTLISHGSGSGSNGSVNIIAGANSGTAISTGKVDTTGGTGGGGNITLATQAPVISGAPVMTIKNGSITNGTSYIGGTVNSASISTAALSSPGGVITITAGADVTTGKITNNGVGANAAGGTINITAAKNGPANLQIKGDVNANGVGTGAGGIININYMSSGSFLVGANGANNFVKGAVSADAGASGINGGSVTITNTAANSLDVDLTGSISANGSSLGNVNFVSQAGQGVSVVGLGSVTAIVNNNNDAGAVTYTVGTGNLKVGTINNASGNIALTNNNASGTITATQNINSAGALSINGGTSGNVVIPVGVTISGTAAANTNAVSVTAPNIALNGSIITNSGNIVLTSTTNGSPLNVNTGAGSAINAVAGNVFINNGVNAPINMNSGFGDISASGGAGLITLAAQGFSSTISVHSLNGNITGNAGSANITVAAGNLNIQGPFNTGGQAATLTNNAAGGKVSFNGGTTNTAALTVKTTNTGSVVVANTAAVNASVANVTTSSFTNNGQFIASSALTVQGNGTNNTLTVNLGSGSNLSGDSVTFNGSGASAGAITMTGGNGTINATGINPSVTFNGGTGAVNVSVNSINGTTTGQGGSVALSVANGQLTLGIWSSSSGNMTFTDSATSGNVEILNNLTSTGTLTVTSGSAGTITAATGNTLSSTGVTLSGGSGGITINGTTSILANSSTGNAGNISIQANNGAITFGTGIVSAQALGAVGNGGNITISGKSYSAANQINANAAKSGDGGSISIAVTGANSDLTADNTLNLFAQGGVVSGNGGSISLSAGRNLTVANNFSFNVGPRAVNSNGGKISLTNGTSATGIIFVNQSLAVNGVGTGAGGQITISANSSFSFVIQPGTTVNGVSGTVSANGAGNGGNISVTNRGSGGMTLPNYANISVAVGAAGGAGGSIILNAGTGLLTIPNGTINVSAAGPGNFNGGSISLTGSSIALSGGSGNTLSLLANASGTGNGGSISAKTTSATGDIILGNGAGDIATISAKGGSSGSTAGNGGTVMLNAGRNLIIPVLANIINVSPSGINGNGGTINLTAGAASASGILQVNQGLSANGTGTGNGGTVSVTYRDGVNPLVVGAVGSASYVAGNITANAGASGVTGGTVNITDSAAGTLGVTLTGNISASGNTNSGNINFTSQSNQAIIVSGPGALNAVVNNNASAGAVTYMPGTGNLVLGNVSNSAGNVLAVANSANASVFTTKNISTPGTLTFTSGINGSSGSVNIGSGTTAAGAAINVNSPSLNLATNAALNANTGNITVQSSAAGHLLTVNLASGSSINAVKGNVAFNGANDGAINIASGTGSISANNGLGTITVNAGSNAAVNVNTLSLNGIVTGKGSTISIASATNNLSLGALTSAIGGITVSNAGNGTSIITSGNIQSASSLVMSQTSSSGSIILGNGTNTSGTTITTASANLTLAGNAALTATTGDVNISGHGPANALTLAFGSGSTITAVSGNVNFNSASNPGSIVTTTSSNGTINARNGSGVVTFNGGTGASSNTVNVNLSSIVGTTVANGSSIALTVANGNLNLGAFNSYINNGSTGNISIIDSSTNGSITAGSNIISGGALSIMESGSNGSLTVNPGISLTTFPGGTDISLSAQTLVNFGNVTANRDLILAADNLNNLGIMTTSRDLDISSFTAGHALTIDPSEGLVLTAARDINFGYNNASQITVTGLPINAGRNVSFNGGNNAVLVTPTTINGTIIGGGPGNLIGGSFNLSSPLGNVTLGAMTSTGAISVVNTDNSGGPNHGVISVVGAVNSTGGAINLSTPGNGALTISALGSVTTSGSGTDISLSSKTITNAGNVNANRDLILTADNLSTTGPMSANRDLDIATFTARAPLSISSANGILLSASRDINFGYNNASKIIVTGVAINAGRNVSFNGGNNAVTANVTSITGNVIGAGANNLIGSSFNLSNTSGSITLGAISTPGIIMVNNGDNSSNGNINVVGALSSTGSTISLSGGTNSTLTISSSGSVVTSGNGTDITLAAKTLVNNGSVISNRDIFLAANSISSTGPVNASRDLNISSFTPGTALNVGSSNGLALTAGRDVNFGYNNASPITVSGVGINAGRNVSFNGGANAVTATVTSIAGTVMGGGAGNLIGASFNLSNTSGSITLGSAISTGAITVKDGDNSSNGNVFVLGNILSSGGAISLSSGANGTMAINSLASVKTSASGTDITLAAKTLTNAGLVTSNRDLIIAADNLSNTGTMTTSRDLDISSFTAGAPLNINSSNGLALIAARDINFGYNNASQITVSGVAINAGRNVSFNGGNNAVIAMPVSVAGTIIGGGAANLIGSSFNLTNTSGSLKLGAAISTGAIIVINGDNVNGNISVVGGISSTGGPISLTAGNNSTLAISASGGVRTLANGTDIILTAKTFTNAGNVNAKRDLIIAADSISSPGTAIAGRDLDVSSLSPGAPLTINAATGLALAAGRDVNLGYNNASQITVTGVAINAGRNVSFNGGSNSVLASLTSVNGTVIGGGVDNLIGSSFNLSSTSGNVVLGAMTSPGAISIVDSANHGRVIVAGAISSTGNAVSIASGDQGAIRVHNGITITGNTGVSLTSPKLVNNGNVIANTGDLSMQSNSASHALTVISSAKSSLIAETGNVNFNSTNAGSVTIEPKTGSNPLGTISANGGNGEVNLNIGTGFATVGAKSIAGIVEDPNANFASPQAGNVFIVTSTGQLTLGNFATSAGHSITALNTGNQGSIITEGNLKAGSTVNLESGFKGSLTVGSGTSVFASSGVNFIAPVQNINGIVTAQTGDVTLQSNAVGQNLTVNFGPAIGGVPTQLTANNGNVNFNNLAAGAISINGGPNNGLISGTDIIMNGGPGTVNSNNQQIIGCIHVNGSSIAIQTAVGNLDFCLGINTSSAVGSGESINIAANGGTVNSGAIITNGTGAGKSAGNVTIVGATGVNVGNINANGMGGASGGVVNISSSGTITGTFISATGTGKGNGGDIYTTSSLLALSGADSSGNSISVNGGIKGTAGNAIIVTYGPQAFTVGNGALTGNGTFGNISGNGLNGGFIILKNIGSGAVNQVINGQITSNATTGFGGKVELEGHQPLGSGPLTVVFNGGLIQATNNANNLGRVGFNGGPNQNISLLGTGIVNGGEFVHAGNLDEFTLEFLSTPAGVVTVSPTVTITNNFANNGILPTPPVAPIVPQRLGLLPFFASSVSLVNPGPDLSKTATDYTPWGHFHYLDFRREEHPHFQLGIAYKRKTTAYIPGTKSYEHSFIGAENNRLLTYGMKLNNSTISNYLNIDRGNILLAPGKEIIVGTHEGNVYMLPGSIAFVMESGADVCIYSLRQSGPKQVSVLVNKHRIFLHPGQMMVLTRQNVHDFENIDADCHMVSYHSAQEVIMPEKEVKVFVAEYSIASAFLAIEPLQQLIDSDDKQDKIAMNQIVKSAVMLGNFASTVDMQQLANLNRPRNDEHSPAEDDEKVLDEANKSMAAKEQPIQ